MFSLGGTELVLIGLLALLLFGPDKLPQMARTVGKFMREFNKYKDIMESTLRTELYAAEHRAPSTPESEIEELERSAEASRAYVAEQAAKRSSEETGAEEESGASAAEDGAAELPVTRAAEPAPARIRRTSPIATDEDEEEGD